MSSKRQVLKAKVRHVEPPPPLRSRLGGQNKDVAVFVTSWDGRRLGKGDAELLPKDFDLYVVGVENSSRAIRSRATELCLNELSNSGDFERFHVSMDTNKSLGLELNTLVFAKRELIEQGNLELLDTRTVRDRRISTARIVHRPQPLAKETSSNRLLQRKRQSDGSTDLLSRVDSVDYQALSDLGIDGNAGAVTMTFRIYSTKLLLINVKMSSIVELNEILARVEPEKVPHAVLFGDFGEDVLESRDELEQRLELEEFSAIPFQLRDGRSLCVARSTPSRKRFFKQHLSGFYELTPGKEDSMAVFYSFRLFAGPRPTQKKQQNRLADTKDQWASMENVPGPPPPRHTVPYLLGREESFRASLIPPPPPANESELLSLVDREKSQDESKSARRSSSLAKRISKRLSGSMPKRVSKRLSSSSTTTTTRSRKSSSKDRGGQIAEKADQKSADGLGPTSSHPEKEEEWFAKLVQSWLVYFEKPEVDKAQEKESEEGWTFQKLVDSAKNLVDQLKR